MRKLAAAVPYLKKAQSLDSSSYAGGHDLALALVETLCRNTARRLLRDMIQRQDTAELRTLLAETAREAGDYMAAATEYQRAAHVEPSEKNIFDWAKCRCTRPWSRRRPSSAAARARNPSGCKSAWASRFTPQRQHEARKALARATHVAPLDPVPYVFLGRVYNVSTAQAGEVAEATAAFR